MEDVGEVVSMHAYLLCLLHHPYRHDLHGGVTPLQYKKDVDSTT